MIALFLFALSADAPTFEISAKESDTVTAIVGADSVVFDVRSRTGIGQFDVKLKTGKWPAQVIVRLHLGSLEGFGVTGPKLRLTGRLKGDLPEVSIPDDSGNWVSQNNDGKWKMPVVQRDKVIEVALPAAVLPAVGGSMKVGWIDAYRN